MRALVVHGGAGAATSPERSERQQAACERALALGWTILADGGSAVDAVVRAVVHLEDDPALNAGYGACLTAAGTVELDASIMEGSERRARGVGPGQGRLDGRARRRGLAAVVRARLRERA